MMKSAISIFFILFIMASCSGKGSSLLPDCDINSGPCIKSLNGKEISLDIEPRPVKAMEHLHFRVKLVNYKEPQSVIIYLSMHGMAMGPNQVLLNKTDKDTYEGRGIIPVCPSGKRLWRAGVIINDKLEEAFLFNVHY